MRRASAAATAFQIIRPELVRGQGNEKLKAGLIGCGGRGTQAMENILTGVRQRRDRRDGGRFRRPAGGLDPRRPRRLKPELSNRFKVDAEHRFVGFDAYKKVVASDVDIVMLAANPGYRPMHFEAAVEARKHIFCEKPMGTDATGVRRFMAAAKKSQELKLTVKSGAQRRSQAWYLDKYKRLQERRDRRHRAHERQLGGHAGAEFQQHQALPQQEARPQVGRPGMAAAQLVSASCGSAATRSWSSTCTTSTSATGSRAGIPWKWSPPAARHGVRAKKNTATSTTTCSADFVYADGAHMSSYCRQYNGSAQNVSERIVGTKGVIDSSELRGAKLPFDPYVQEHTDMMDSILGKGPYINEAQAVAESTLTCIMGREAAYSGQKVTWEMIMNSKQDLMPKNFDYKASFPVPPLPVPGVYKFV